MRQVVNRLLVYSLLLTVLPLQAQAGDDPGSELGTGEITMVQVVTRDHGSDHCLAPVAVTRIDGEKRVVPAHGFLIEAGVHSINGRAALDISSCPLRDRNLQLGRAADLVVNFETGKTYYIAYDHGAINSDEWKLVVWKVEQPSDHLYFMPTDLFPVKDRFQ